MTNETILLKESLNLMEQGILKGTGEYFNYTNEDGEEMQMEIPEAIHTYQAWKKLGFQVEKGQKAIAKFKIWKHTSQKAKDENGEIIKDKNGNDETIENLYMVNASWFKAEQVKPIEQ